MNGQLLKSKRVEKGLIQRDIATLLGISNKAVCQKERSFNCRFKVNEILKLTERLGLTMQEFDAIFFDYKLTKCISGSESITERRLE